MAEGKKARVAKLYISPLPFWNECHYSASRKATKSYFIIVLNLIRRIIFYRLMCIKKTADYKLSYNLLI
jgi:hypothetical protein